MLRKEEAPSLFVGDLHPGVTNAELAAIFAPFRPLQTTLLRNTAARLRRPIARIHFSTADEAQRAFIGMKYTCVRGRQIWLCPWEGACERERSENARLFLSNLNPSIDAKSLEYLLQSSVQGVLWCRVLLDDAGASKGLAHIQMESEISAVKAIQELNSYPLFDNGQKKMTVSKYVKMSSRQVCRESFVTVRSLELWVTGAILREVFGNFGRVRKSGVLQGRLGARTSSGYICYETNDEAKTAVSKMDGKFLGATRIQVQLALKKSDSGGGQPWNPVWRGTFIIVGSLEWWVTEVFLKEQFRMFGHVKKSGVLQGRLGGVHWLRLRLL